MYCNFIVSDKIEAFIRRRVRLGFYVAGDPTAQQLVEEADERLFRRVRYSEHHVLQHLLPDIISHRYSLHPRRHYFVLTTKTDQRNFIARQLFSDINWCCLFVSIVSFPHCNQSRSARLKLKLLIDYLTLRTSVGIVWLRMSPFIHTVVSFVWFRPDVIIESEICVTCINLTGPWYVATVPFF